jgi:hypothetical protein
MASKRKHGAMGGKRKKLASPSDDETSDEVPLFASRNVDSCDKPRIEVLTARDRVEEEDSEPEPDYLIAGESKPYIDRSQDDDTENLGLFLLISSTRAANDARQTVVALGTGTIEFKTYSEKR